ncbi:hypothetical protein MTR67_050777 [Solanum verrucosum]|uniref:F-box domain-containing protein n=1 Tax=Solanum verrucosum TaxID=315347 RepID=A0AAF0ZYK5_SOLVR|nr:hypothetical protein MTR67_050777 [Solanum verrucosum]
MEIHFPEEIIVDILIRLPVPSLLRFKCASKFWKTIISDQYFKVKHYNYAKNNKKILITGLSQIPEAGTHISYYCSSLSSSQPLQNLCCPSNHKPCNYIILCCCDGLALLCCRRGDHLLWNPSTNESVQLPNHEITSLFGSTYGLGYDSISDDYKILRVEHMVNGRGRPSKILALKSGSWRKIGNHPRGFRNKIIPCKNSLPFVRGAFHWLSKDSLLKYIMISFNISNEVYGEISLPEEIYNTFNVNYVRCFVFEGMLCAYCNGREGGMDTFKLWVMKDYGVKESWTKLYTIRKTHIFLVIPIYMFADGEVLFYYEEDSFYRDFRTSKGPYEPLPSNSTLLQGFVYTESLISPKLLILSK